MRWAAWSLGVLLALGGTGFTLWSREAPKMPNLREARPVPVLAATAVRRDVPVTLEGLGTVQAYHAVTVRSRIDGILDQVTFREGQDVRAGDVLARIDPRAYQAQLDQAQATRARDEALLENARVDLERYTGLGNNVQKQIADTARATVRQLEATVRGDQAAVDNARVLLSYATIASPIDGRTGFRQVDAGNLVRANDPGGLVVVSQLQPVFVLFSLPQQELPAINARLRQGERLPVQVTGPDGRTVIDTGELVLVDNQIDTATGTIRLKAVVPNAERQLWPGGFVSVRLQLDTRRGGTVVPAVAIQRGPKGSYVFVVNGDETVTLRPVAVSRVAQDMALVESGLEMGERVVTEGMSRLKDGAKVTLPDPGGGKSGGKGGPGDKGKGAGASP
ncbi:MAG: efflux RND transporter periplasmic adaptor subunit [Alphaproteobacteria bacterium]